MSRKRVYVRPMTLADVPAVAKIDAMEFSHPMFEEDFAGFFKSKSRRQFVIDTGYAVQAFLVLHIEKEAEFVERMATHCDFGDDMQAMFFFLPELRKRIRDTDRRLVVPVNDHDDAAIEFFRSQGFMATGIIREACEDESDAICFEFGEDLVRERG